MEYGSIEREIHIDAAPEVVFDVITSPAHIREWWGGVAADFEPVAGANGQLVFGHKSADDPMVVALTVVDVVPPKLFSFRWVHPAGEVATPANSLLVTFELAASGAGTTLRMTENGFREIGWDEAVAIAAYQDHCNGWDAYVPQIGEYVMRLAAAS